jgi:hypothetical protein
MFLRRDSGFPGLSAFRHRRGNRRDPSAISRLGSDPAAVDWRTNQSDGARHRDAGRTAARGCDEAGLQFLAPHQNWILFSLSFVTALILSYVWDAPSAAVRNFLAERGLMRYLMVPAFSPTSPSGSAGAAGRAGAG